MRRGRPEPAIREAEVKRVARHWSHVRRILKFAVSTDQEGPSARQQTTAQGTSEAPGKAQEADQAAKGPETPDNPWAGLDREFQKLIESQARSGLATHQNDPEDSVILNRLKTNKLLASKPIKDKGVRSHKADMQLEKTSPASSSSSSEDSALDEALSSDEMTPVGEKRKRHVGKLPKAKIARISKQVSEAFRLKQTQLRQEQERTRQEESQRSLLSGMPHASMRKADSGAEASNRSIIVDDHDNWVYATPEDIANPVGGYVIQLVNSAWQRGAAMEPFVLNPIVSERFTDWCDYEKRLLTHLKLKGDCSQWQRGLYAASALGSVISDLVNRKKWIAKHPIEGCKHFDILLGKLKEYFRQFSNPSTAHDNLMSAAQGANEAVMDFYERLLKMAEVCGLSHKSILVKNALIKGLRDKVLRELVTCQPFTVQGILAAGLAKESHAYTERTRKQNAPQQVLAIASEPSTSGQAGDLTKPK